MIYNAQKIRNKLLVPMLAEWIHENVVGPSNLILLGALQKSAYKEPNIAFQVGSFILTVILCVCSAGLILLFLGNGGNDTAFGMMLTFFAGISLSAVVFLIRRYGHFKSGVDTGLYYFSAACFIPAFALVFRIDMNNDFYVFLFTSYCSILLLLYAYLFFDRFLAMGGLFVFAIGYALIFEYGNPYVTVAAAGTFVFTCYAVYRTLIYAQHKINIVYGIIFPYMHFMLALLAYVALNRNFIFELLQHNPQPLPSSFSKTMQIVTTLWSWVIPIFYIYYGLKNNSRAVLLAGLICIALYLFSIPYFQPSIRPEILMLAGGISCFIIVWLAKIFFISQKWSVTIEKPKYGGFFLSKELQGIIFSQAIQTKSLSGNTKFDGGSFGGGGATNDF